MHFLFWERLAFFSESSLRLDELQFKILKLFGIKISNHGERATQTLLQTHWREQKQLRLFGDDERRHYFRTTSTEPREVKEKGEYLDNMKSWYFKFIEIRNSQIEYFHYGISNGSQWKSEALKKIGEEQPKADINNLIKNSKLSTTFLITNKTSLVSPEKKFPGREERKFLKDWRS